MGQSRTVLEFPLILSPLWMSYRGASRFSGASAAPAVGKRRPDTRDYFDDDDEPDPVAPSAQATAAGGEEDIDPLDQFMAGVDNQVLTQQSLPHEQTALPEIVSGQERDYEGYYDMMDRQAKADAEAAEVEYDSDGVPVGLRGAADKKAMYEREYIVPVTVL